MWNDAPERHPGLRRRCLTGPHSASTRLAPGLLTDARPCGSAVTGRHSCPPSSIVQVLLVALVLDALPVDALVLDALDLDALDLDALELDALDPDAVARTIVPRLRSPATHYTQRQSVLCDVHVCSGGSPRAQRRAPSPSLLVTRSLLGSPSCRLLRGGGSVHM